MARPSSASRDEWVGDYARRENLVEPDLDYIEIEDRRAERILLGIYIAISAVAAGCAVAFATAAVGRTAWLETGVAILLAWFAAAAAACAWREGWGE